MLRALCSVLLVPFRLNHSLPAKRVTSMKQTFFLFALLIFTARAVTDLPAGSAKGSLTYDGATAELKFAAAFVDQKDERKPIILLITDQRLPVEKWKSEFDMMMDHTKWSGVVFFLDKEGQVFRSDVHTNGRQSSVSGIFEV